MFKAWNWSILVVRSFDPVTLKMRNTHSRMLPRSERRPLINALPRDRRCGKTI